MSDSKSLADDDANDDVTCVQVSQLPFSPDDERYIAKDREVNLLRYVSLSVSRLSFLTL